MGNHVIDPMLRPANVERIGAYAPCDRCVKGLEGREVRPSQPRPAEAVQLVLEQFGYAGDVLGQRRVMRVISTRTPTFIGHWLRKAEKPPCISHTAL